MRNITLFLIQLATADTMSNAFEKKRLPDRAE